MSASGKLFVFFLCMCGFSFGESNAWGENKYMGLSVEPGWFLFSNVPVGQLYDMEYQINTRFKISNGSDKPRRYSVKADSPDKVGVKVLKGYTGIPDPAWFWFEKDEVLVPANGISEIKMFLRIPFEEKYYNQKWAVGINVEGKPESGEGLVLAVSPVFYIETVSGAELKEKPAGLLGVTPSTIILANAALGKSKTASAIKVYNNDNRAHHYKIGSIIPFAEPGRQVITPSAGLSWMPNPEWLVPSAKAIEIGPHKQKTITFDLDIPDKTDVLDQRREALVFVESEEGLSGFVRVQISTSSGKGRQ